MGSAKLKQEWRSIRPTEMEAVTENDIVIRIKQSVGKLSSPDAFWYCHHGNKYVGVEKTLALAQARALSGRMRMPAADLDDWLKQWGDELPDDLLEAERARLEAWQKNPQPSPRLTDPIPSPRPGGRQRSAMDSGEAAPAKVKADKTERPARVAAGRVEQNAVVRVVKRQPTGKPGTKWRTRQEHVFSMEGKTVAEVKDNDAVKHMLQDGTIKLEAA